MLTALSILLVLAPAQPLTLYVGPQVKDGFVDIDAGVVDSVADIKGQVAGTGLRVVATEAEAAIKLYVLSRERFATGSSVSTASGVAVAPGIASGSGVTVGIDAMRVHSRLKVGNYERTLTGEGSSFKKAAQAIVKDVQTWVEANRSRLDGVPKAP
jgi:hypothetical protein